MRVAFFGHASFHATEEIKENLMRILKNITDEGDVEFFFGGYGQFDSFALSCVMKIRSSNKLTRTFVTPYITEDYQKNHLSTAKELFDNIVYPPIESVPLKFAISARNKWIGENSDVVICYVSHGYGGAYTACKHAKRHGVKILNLADFEI